MKHQFPKPGMSITSIALLVVFICSLFVLEVSPSKAEESPEFVWVLSETQINPDNAQLEFYGGGATPGWFTEARFEGTFLKYAVSESSFRIDDRFVDHEYEYHNVAIETYFEKPPLKLIPGETIELIYGFSHSGSEEDGGIGVQFWYNSEHVNIQPDTVFGYAPWSENFDGTAEGSYTFFVPPASDGSEIELYASLWNAEPCLVVWKYQAQEVSQSAGEEGVAPIPDEESGVDEPDRSPNTKSMDDDLPEWVKQGQVYIDQYGEAIYVPEWLDWIKPERIIKQRGVILPWPSEGEVWVYNRAFNKWYGPIQSETVLYSGDIVSTDPDAQTRVMFTNDEGKQDTISIGSNTLLEVPSIEQDSKYPTLWTIYEGAAKIKRAILRETPPQVEPSPFIMRTPSVLCGISDRKIPLRGEIIPRSKASRVHLASSHPSAWEFNNDYSETEDEWEATADIYISHDPKTQISAIYVIDGELNYYNLITAGSDDGILTGGQKLVVSENGKETVSMFSDDEIEVILASSNIVERDNLDQEEFDKLFSQTFDSEYQGTSENANLRLVIFGAIMCLLIAFGTVAVIVFFIFVSKMRTV